MKRDTIIIGAGVVGLMCAYHLHKAGRKVTIIDEGDITDCTSFGNAGLLSAFDKGCLAYPGVISTTMKQMLKGESPVNIHPKLDPKLFTWLFKFAASANEKRFKRTVMLFEKYGEDTLKLYEKMQKEDNLDFDYHRKGMLSVFTEDATYEKKLKECESKDKKTYKILSKEETKEYLPCGNEKIKGSILFTRNAHFDPKRVMLETKEFLEKEGVEFILNEKIIDIKFSNKKVKSVSSLTNTYEAENFILSTGYQTLLADIRKKSLMMTPAKGYSITFSMPNELKPKTSTLFSDLFIVMTPRRDSVRLTSKLELGSTDTKVVKEQIDSIKSNFEKYTLPFEMKDIKEWTGFRPLTPNDIPLFGRDEEYKNLVYAMGMGWLGMTFAPSIGKIVRKIITKDLENKNSDDVLLFSGFYQ
ncbi:D-amino-acid dehydrogenase [Arcobacter nitrofigilis DSM 7299]|uniref:D-amino-acid dehydrogenase n=1 Tax=Arcobacter nitrofigilis (strain ATCC 33309 / DSM 7299 / CCUG 15893 / LMG 7604 / NCTC 12251 / CI) TaxID=572480 RepID=D5V3S4_ARCNC|nr:FAD-dependent oxidoreductase [Arcobacter nitrofigilis]ADG92752.1 D-amino-acid dehydrogenase [Arcobacter nitrofigilis DSM 7299]